MFDVGLLILGKEKTWSYELELNKIKRRIVIDRYQECNKKQ